MTQHLASLKEETEVLQKREKSKPPPPKKNSPLVVNVEFDFAEWLKEQWHWRRVKFVQILCVVFVVIYTFGGFEGASKRTEDGWIVDSDPENTANGIIVTSDGLERSIVATSTFQLVCLSIARVTAFYMYPTLVLIYFSKLRATANLIAQTPFEMYVCDDWHDLHVYCGWSIFINSVLHTIFHIIRYVDQGNLELLVTNRSGLSGLIVFISLLLICLPMMFTSVKQYIKYEVRKGFHYFFYIFAIAMVFHSPASAWPNGGWAPYVFGILIAWYFLDAFYCSVMLTEKIDTTVFDVLPTGVQMTMAVSNRYDTGFMGGYCYICLPWVDRNQWHAFSLFEHPTNPGLKQVFMLKTGDWTSAVHRQLQRNTARPVWVQGPYLSPYNKSVDYDNQIMVASGIGITPALSVIQSQKETRRTNLIWMVRDPALLEFFLERAYLDHSGWNLFFYTGKKPLVSARIDQLTSTNVQVIKGRPDLPKVRVRVYKRPTVILTKVIRNIIYGIESGKGSPQQYLHDQKVEVTDALLNVLEELDDDITLTAQDKFQILADTAMEHGFQLTNALYGLDKLFKNSSMEDSTQQSSEGWDLDRTAEMDGESSRRHETVNNAEEQIIEKLQEMVGDRQTSRGNFYQKLQPGSDHSRAGLRRRSRVLCRAGGMRRMSGHLDTLRGLSSHHATNRFSTFGGMPSHHSRFGGLGGHSSFNNTSHMSFATSSRFIPRPSMAQRKRTSGSQQARTSNATAPIAEEEPEEFLNEDSSHARQAARDILVGEAMEIGFKPWEANDEAEEYVTGLDESILATWGLLYCGGSKIIEDKLKLASTSYNVQLHSENFSW